MRIRDFIYLDNDLLYSLYSQVFKGVVEAVVNSYTNDKESSERHRGLDTKVAEASTRVENRVLYDHMYNTLEEKLQTIIYNTSEVPNLSIENLQDKSFVKIKGHASIHDYERLNYYLDNFNKLGEAVAYANLQPESQENISKNTLSKYAKEHGLYLSDTLIKNIKTHLDVFYNQSYEVNIISPNNPQLLYKGVVNKAWLRVSSNSIRELYGGYPMMDWIMVGKITEIPSHTSTPPAPTVATQKSISDSYIELFQSYYNVESVSRDSKQYTKIHIMPIAIYTETDIGDIK